MQTFDPATGEQLPSEAIQRVLFIAPAVHVYNIPPLASNKGYMAATWTEDPKRHIFTARLRAIETAVPQAGGEDKVKTDIVLEDSSTGQLFAAAPYTSAAVVEPTLDSSRFFAVRVQDPAGRKAILGVGFEERSESFDFGVALQEARKALGLDQDAAGGPHGKPVPAETRPEIKRDWSLKEGETITVNLKGSKFGSRPRDAETKDSENAPLSSFSLAPPPSAPSSSSSNSLSSGGGFSLPPPPSAPPRSHARSPSHSEQQKRAAADLGFDDGQNGEFA
ncbi:hypothetical protein MCOR27_000371 [Pyricularia oryzae]|uniref:NECAP PHear domain-containing protein n=5 Tax=Pyricularia TaxID=48558 RepID=A0ABQ8NR19_PYRGI|nr:adaptin ear-binding coat-associated protein 2 [Pyricularia oryzae 70-15]ELQ40013.1 adaptin ear-binding coat-associated protein 2 [Pyricularia oryzae Y34]KAH8847382.1 hypothetical protein MCOR01_000814 [Pyricularia oryzae]KAI6300897.1 hypothetical protein MCOR33_003522 [Pyricularia grisea]EHA52133.1 adaptin ear-binding coat-associated protein 2 [Pyricularia oryzae 70-15]KAH9428422.1 hypothetical protein MCOR02_010975 [Pyricularia oryzae]